MNLIIDLGPTLNLLVNTPLVFVLKVLLYSLPIVALIFLGYGFLVIRLHWMQTKYMSGVKYALLAIDIPKNNEQSLLAVEQMFATLASIRTSPNFVDKYFKGKVPLSLSLEILSLEGFIQFLIRTPVVFKQLVESAIYSQYSDAEIVEVDDYTKLIPDNIWTPESEYKLWGTEFVLAKPSPYPIKTYESFEHRAAELIIDPMSPFLEIMSHLGKGEQMAMQLVITPVNDDWKVEGKNLLAKLLGVPVEAIEHLGDKFVKHSLNALEKFSESLLTLWGDIDDKKDNKKDQPMNKLQYLTQSEKDVIHAIQNKLSKICFAVTFRFYYLAHRDIFDKAKGVAGFIGAILQFNTSNMNAFRPHEKIKTDVDYFFVDSRVAKRTQKLVKFFKSRSREGANEFYLSTEELATIYHFPAMTIKAPTLQRVEAKKGEPPSFLPTVNQSTREYFKAPPNSEMPGVQSANYGGHQTTSLKDDLKDSAIDSPSSEDVFKIVNTLPGYDFGNNVYEERFSLAKTSTNSPDHADDIEPPANLPIIN